MSFEQLLKNIAQEKSAWNIKLAETALWAAYYGAGK